MRATLARRVWRLLAIIMLAMTALPAAAETLLFHATMPGRQTLDEGEGGGNPFASALIESLEQPLLLSSLPAKMRQLTAAKSNGFQAADIPRTPRQEFSLVPARMDEDRVALVMVVTDYGASGGVRSLPGARFDAERVAGALEAAGFRTEMVLDLDLAGMRAKLEAFRVRSRNSDAAIVYTTGHGVQVGGTTFLLPGNYPVAEGNAVLTQRALPLPEIARSPAATRINLVFYGGCRDNPFAQ